MPSQELRIHARSRAQAMDWSLVLISQGIDSTIDHAENDAGWGLLVASENFLNAVTVIQQYSIENRLWPWQREIFYSGRLFDLAGLGLLAVESFSFWRKTPHPAMYVIAGIAGGVMLFALLGLSPGTDVLAHLGGFLSGLFLGALLAPFPFSAKSTPANIAGGFLFACVVILPWWLCLRCSHLPSCTAC